jgi:hypothetical protein
MLQYLPFIRRDIASVRADDYPIRLWTVAVFLFGTLPLMRSRGLGRLVIGNEFDTTRRANHKGIPHYDGLFDQSRWFDARMSRYFRQKRWNVSAFSVVRPLSELLVDKILVERYPEIQRLQTSCHATHIKGDRVLPCGRCEKCRRVVGMLVALGADPTRCGYTAEQIAHCLEELATRGIHQESAGEQHLCHLLHHIGALPKPGRAHHEIAKVRIDDDRSPLEAVPAELRRGLLTIFLEHADGAVRRSGRV